jgi:TP901 family phage tail tape measure protein
MSVVADELLLRIAVEGGAVAADEVAGFEARMTSAGTAATGFGTRMRGVGRALTSLKTLFAGLAIGAAIKEFSTFQRQMELLHTQTGASQIEVGKMSKAILSMATSVGTGPNSLAQALYHIESIKLRGSKAADALRISAEGAKVGMADLTDTTNALDAVLVAGFAHGKNMVSQLRDAMGQLNATTGAGDMTMQNLAEAMSHGVLATVQTLHLKLVDMNAALATLGDNNIRGAKASTLLRMGLMKLVHPSSTSAKAIKSMHMGVLELSEDLQKPRGLLTMLEDLKKHLPGGNTAQDKAMREYDLSAVFGGGRNSSGMLTLLNQLTRLKSKYVDIEKGGHDFNQAWQATTKTLGYLIDQLKALGEVLLIKVGGGINAAVKWIMGKFVPALKQGKEWAALIAAAIGGITLRLIGPMALDAAIGIVRLAMIALSEVPLIALFTVIGLAVIELSKHFGQIEKVAYKVKRALVSVWSGIKDETVKFVSFMNKILGPLSPFPNVGGGKSAVDKAIVSGRHATTDKSGVMMPWGPVDVSPNAIAVIRNMGVHMADTRYGEMLSPTPEQARKIELELHITNNMDGRVVSKQVVRQGLMAQARRGYGGAVLADAG